MNASLLRGRLQVRILPGSPISIFHFIFPLITVCYFSVSQFLVCVSHYAAPAMSWMIRLRSAALVYRSTSERLKCPDIAMISCVDLPFSAQ